MAFILKALGGIAALILLVITLLGSIVTLGGFLLTAITPDCRHIPRSRNHDRIFDSPRPSRRRQEAIDI